MPIPPSGPLQVKLGELAHADVGVPGRRLVSDSSRGWVAEADRPGRFRSWHLWVALLLPLGGLLGVLVPRSTGAGVGSSPVAVVASQPRLVAAEPTPPPPSAPSPAVPLPTIEPSAPTPVATPRAPRKPRRVPAASASPEAVLPTAPDEAPAPAAVSPRSRDVLVAIKDPRTIVTPDARGLPTPFRVGEQLPSGARLLRVDMRAGEAETDRGVIRLE